MVEDKKDPKRIQFRPVSPEAKSTPGAPAPSSWTAHPAKGSGEKTSFPGIFLDQRGIRVGRQGVLWFSQESPVYRTGTVLDRVLRLLAYLSQKMPLADSIVVWKLVEGDYLVFLTPPPSAEGELSLFYDGVATAARCSGGLCYLGQERTFIQYRDDRAPRGYEAEGVQAPEGDEWYLVDSQGTHRFSCVRGVEESLAGLLLRMLPVLARHANLPEVAFALTRLPLYPMLARYLIAHHLQYRVARFSTSLGENFVLLEITSRVQGAPIPQFVLTYLSTLPRCVVLTKSGSETMLVQWGYRHPCCPDHILKVFPENSLLLFSAAPDLPSRWVTPIPQFFEEADLLALHAWASPAQAQCTPAKDREDLQLPLSVRLVSASGPLPTTAALILDDRQTQWLRPLLYQFPGEAFGAYQFCRGKECTVLLSEKRPIHSLPFGLPLRRVQDTPLFIPLALRFLPDLPWTLLANVFEIQPDRFTFLTPTCRYDIPREAFVPLSRIWVTGPERPRVEFEMRAAPVLPALNWQPPASQSISSSPAHPRSSARPSVSFQNPRVILSHQGESCRRSGDFLSAAICFALAQEDDRAGECYEQAANAKWDGTGGNRKMGQSNI